MEKRKICAIGLTGLVILLLVQVLVSGVHLASIQHKLQPANFVFVLTAFSISAILSIQVIALRKKTKQIQLHENESLQRIHSYIGQVVHDLRSPAASINMLSEFLSNELNPNETEHLKMIEAIQKSSTTMLDRIVCILDNTKLAKGIDHIELTTGSPYEIINTAIENHHILAIDKNITIQTNLSEHMPHVYFEKEALESVISNLLSNAIKYSPSNTKISIYSKVQNGSLLISVKDQGLGMTNDDLNKVFGEFTKLSARPTGGEGSSGLGLSLVKKLVEQMGGTVNAMSQGRNLGSTFSFELKTTAKIKRISA